SQLSYGPRAASVAAKSKPPIPLVRPVAPRVRGREQLPSRRRAKDGLSPRLGSATRSTPACLGGPESEDANDGYRRAQRAHARFNPGGRAGGPPPERHDAELQIEFEHAVADELSPRPPRPRARPTTGPRAGRRRDSRM